MDIYRRLKKFAFLSVLSAFFLAMTPCVTMAGGGPEPGPDDGGRYSYAPPPFSGNVQFELRFTGIPTQYELVMVQGTLEQMGNSDCSIEVDPAGLQSEIGFAPNISEEAIPTCQNLHPNDFMGFTAEALTTGAGCSSGSIDIEILATAKLLCQPAGDQFPAGGTAKLIVMEWVPK